MLALSGSEAAAVVMIDLLRTYSEETASEAREEAQRCVLAALADPDTFLLDHLLSLKPVQSLEGTPVHQLLDIFVSQGLRRVPEVLRPEQGAGRLLG